VGRGFLPEGVKQLTELRSQITRLQDMVSKKKPSDLEVIKDSKNPPEFAFYEELSQKKEEAAKIHRSRIKQPENKEVPDQTKSVKKPPPVTPVTEKPTETVKEGAKYTVQIASLKKEIEAIRMANKMVGKGYPAFYLKADVQGKTYFRVRCGRFESRKEADEFLALLAGREKIKGFVARIEQ